MGALKNSIASCHTLPMNDGVKEATTSLVKQSLAVFGAIDPLSN